MTVTLDNSFPKLKDKVLDAIIQNPPSLGKGYDFIAIDAEDVGVSFEPRVKVNYKVSSDEEIEKLYTSTFVFSKKYDFETIVDEGWVEK